MSVSDSDVQPSDPGTHSFRDADGSARAPIAQAAGYRGNTIDNQIVDLYLTTGLSNSQIGSGGVLAVPEKPNDQAKTEPNPAHQRDPDLLQSSQIAL